MPGELLTIKSTAGHHFQLTDTPARNQTITKKLKPLRCNNCATVDYKGRSVDVCARTICKQCSYKPPYLIEELKDRCPHCFDAIVKNRFLPFKLTTKVFLDHLKVSCNQTGRNKQDILKRMDHHMAQEHPEHTEHTEHQLLGMEFLSPLNPDESNADQSLVISIDLGYI